MQPRVLKGLEKTPLIIFKEDCNQYNFENKTLRYEIKIEDIYFDFGQNWLYTALVTYDTDTEGRLDSWQSLNPRDWELLVECRDIDKIIDMAWYYMDMLTSGKPIKLYEKFE